MHVWIEYRVVGESGTWTIEHIFPWAQIAEYKIYHVGISDEVVVEELAKNFLKNEFKDDVEFVGILHR